MTNLCGKKAVHGVMFWFLGLLVMCVLTYQ